MKVFIIGYGRMAAKLALGVLQSGHELVGVFRADKLRYDFFESICRDFFCHDDFYSIIKKYGIKELNTDSVNDKRFINKIKKLNTDVILVGSCGEIFKEKLINAPKVACLNVHPSLLPKYRGANPYFYAIKNGEKESGVTFHLVSKKIDAGDILMQESLKISDVDTGQTLRIKSTHKAFWMVKELLDNLDRNLVIPVPQIEEAATYYPHLSYEDVKIDWSSTSKSIYNLVRAAHPWCCCYTQYKDELLEIREAQIVSHESASEHPGMVLKNDDTGILVSTGEKNKAILLTDVKVYCMFSDWFSRGKLKKIKCGEFLT